MLYYNDMQYSESTLSRGHPCQKGLEGQIHGARAAQIDYFALNMLGAKQGRKLARMMGENIDIFPHKNAASS